MGQFGEAELPHVFVLIVKNPLYFIFYFYTLYKNNPCPQIADRDYK